MTVKCKNNKKRAIAFFLATFLLFALEVSALTGNDTDRIKADIVINGSLERNEDNGMKNCSGGGLSLSWHGYLEPVDDDPEGLFPAAYFEASPKGILSIRDYTCRNDDGEASTTHFQINPDLRVLIQLGLAKGFWPMTGFGALTGVPVLAAGTGDPGTWGSPPESFVCYNLFTVGPNVEYPNAVISPQLSLTADDFKKGFTREYSLKGKTECGGPLIISGRVTLRYKDISLKILNPTPDEAAVFRSGKLVIQAEAEVEPEKYQKEVIWEVEDIKGSTKTIDPRKGHKVTITFDRLPRENNQFGGKVIKARLHGKEAQVKFRSFFERDGKDNPGEKDPNWFYYWRQGAVEGLERFKYKTGGSYYSPSTNELVISDEAAGGLEGGSVPLKKKVFRWGAKEPCLVKGSISLEPTNGVYSAARIVAHELGHERFSKMSRTGRDKDEDQVPDDLENSSPFCLDPRVTNTHSINIDDGAAGDSEVLAIDAESKSKARVKRDLDWASPGSQL